MTLDKLPDRDLVNILLRNIKLDEFDTPLDKIHGVTVNMKRLRRELKTALSRYDISEKHPHAGRFQEL